MGDIDISIYYNERRLEAMQKKLAEQGTTVEIELKNMMDVLYESVLPVEVCAEIDAQIAKEQVDADAEYEAARRFGVYHIRQNGEDTHFISELYNSFYSAAYRYRVYSRSVTDADFFALFVNRQPIDTVEFSKFCDAMNTDPRITTFVEFDLDEGTVSTYENGHDGWISYNLKDVSNAIYKANRKHHQTSEMRQNTFNYALAGKEIHYAVENDTETEGEATDEDEGEGEAQSMQI